MPTDDTARGRLTNVRGRPVSYPIEAPAARVWEVLSDGWSYVSWIVGTACIRAVDGEWPKVGSRLYHRAGPWPVTLEGHSEVEACVPGTELVLVAHGWPFGAARVQLRIEDQNERSVVHLAEDVVAGPTRFLPRQVRQSMIRPRNQECLRRLAMLATRPGAQRRQ